MSTQSHKSNVEFVQFMATDVENDRQTDHFIPLCACALWDNKEDMFSDWKMRKEDTSVRERTS